MRIIPFLISLAVTVLFLFAFSHRWNIGGNLSPRFGSFLSPQQGIWQNAEASDADYSLNLNSPLLQDKVDVYFDDRLVPHVFAQNEHDVYFVQGYLHAKFRLWQMEFQTHAAAGRLAELNGRMKGDYSILDKRDRLFRRLGMGWAAEHSLAAMEANPDTKMVMDAYTAGINFFIQHLRKEDYPIEYKLLDYQPEPWTNLKTALFLKYMSYDLAAYEADFEHSSLLSYFTQKQYEQAYPYGQDSLAPIIPHDTAFHNPTVKLKVPATADSVYLSFLKDTLHEPAPKPNPYNGSNNWAVAGSKTASGKPILCGDPHLGLNFPSLWYEMQLHTPQWNTYGVSFPGAPAIAIGFNDSIAWSETNAMRDVKDYYEIRFKDASENEYWFNNEWVKTEWRLDTIKVLGEPNVIDSIPITIMGPVMYDKRYANPFNNGKAYAVRWKAHDGSNEEWTFIKLARAKNYKEYKEAIKTFECPGQNFVFASKSGDIAMWCQGAFPAKWRRQGDFVMPGTDSSYFWQGTIPMQENPHQKNPMRGFVSSANQYPVDTTYPYYLGGSFDYYRSITINKMLQDSTPWTPQRMQAMQLNSYNGFAAVALPLLTKYLYDSTLSIIEKKYANALRNWDWNNEANQQAPAIFEALMDALEKNVYEDELTAAGSNKVVLPQQGALIEALLKDSAYSFVDDVTTPAKETLAVIILKSIQQATHNLEEYENRGGWDWQTVNNPQVVHLLRLPAFSKKELPTGGGRNVINAVHGNHGPSWRMIVHLTDQTEAYGIYPGGQSGNPGSRFYDNFVDEWAVGKYYSLWVMKPDEISSNKVKWKMQFSKS